MFYSIKGKNNKIFLIKNGTKRQLNFFEKIRGFRINITGNNNIIEFNCDSKDIKDCSINIIGDSSRIEIGKSNHLHNLKIGIGSGNNQIVKIGNNSIIEGLSLYLWEENAKVIIGENALISSHVHIWATDGHSIIDKNTKKLINTEKKGVIIGNNCWLGQHAFLTKNTVLPEYTIVSAHSVVTGEFTKPNTVIAGTPAKIIKDNVEWRHVTPTEYLKAQNL